MFRQKAIAAVTGWSEPWQTEDSWVVWLDPGTAPVARASRPRLLGRIRGLDIARGPETTTV